METGDTAVEAGRALLDGLRALRAEFGGAYTITVIRGGLYAWRHDGTTATVGPARDDVELRAAIVENQRSRPRVPHPRGVS